jgi:hypothetical protein
VIESPVSPAEALARLDPIVARVNGFWGWIDFWLRWDGLNKRIKFAGVLDANAFALRRVHGIRFFNFVSVVARGRVDATDGGSRISVSVGPTFEECWYLLLLIPLGVWNVLASSDAAEAIGTSALIIGVPVAWFLYSRSREAKETESRLRAIFPSRH